MEKRIKALEGQVRTLRRLLALAVVLAGGAVLTAQTSAPLGTKQEQVWARLVMADQIEVKRLLVAASPGAAFAEGLALIGDSNPSIKLYKDGAARVEIKVDASNTPLIMGHDPEWRYPAERPLTLK